MHKLASRFRYELRAFPAIQLWFSLPFPDKSRQASIRSTSWRSVAETILPWTRRSVEAPAILKCSIVYFPTPARFSSALGGEGDVLMAELRAKGVETFRFGATPHPKLDIELRSEATFCATTSSASQCMISLSTSDVERIAMIDKAPSASARSSRRQSIRSV